MQTIFEKMGGTYRWEDGYRIPDLEPPEDIDIGLWGQRHAEYLRKHRTAVHLELLVTGKLNRYLADINQQAEDMLIQLVTQFQKLGDVTEELKATDQMEWVRRMNSIRHRAEEIVYKELIWV